MFVVKMYKKGVCVLNNMFINNYITVRVLNVLLQYVLIVLNVVALNFTIFARNFSFVKI